MVLQRAYYSWLVLLHDIIQTIIEIVTLYARIVAIMYHY